jgi:multiple sugar transport system substrate-binding protein
MVLSLKGMTWSHPRGHDPMVACSALWRQKTGVVIEWDKRSLQDFESFPIEELACRYDPIVIDHPHVGQITAEACLAPLDVPGRQVERDDLSAGSVGASYRSYEWAGRQWAFPIDAAAQVQAWRPDLIDAAALAWREVECHAAAGAVLLPLRSPHALMCLYTLTANLGHPCDASGKVPLVDAATGRVAYALLARLAAQIDQASFDMDPRAVFERMAQPRSGIALAPLIYGYVSYARDGFRPARIAFADIPAVGADGPTGSTLGGTGIAVSARSIQIEAAIDFAYWVASGEVQRGPYAAAGGQAGHASAWEDVAVNAPVLDFYRRSRATLERAWLRPRHDGYMPFQDAASERLRRGLMEGTPADPVIADINALFERSLQKPPSAAP